MGKRLAIEHDLIRPNEVIELLEMMGGKNKDNADGCSFLYYTLCTPKINNPNNEKVICGFTNLKMQNDYFAIFTLEKFWKKYPYKLNELVLCDDGLLGVITKMEWDCEKSDMKYQVYFNTLDYNEWYSSKNIKCKYMAGKKLAIKGHPTRGKEVIELLEMMGGSNIHNLSGNDIYSYYIIKGFKNEIHDELYIFGNENIYYFTLEEFLEKYPFKLNDKVIDEADGCPGVVCEMKWDEDVSDMKYCVAFGNGIDFGWFANDSIEFCKENKNLEETQSKRDIDKSEFVIKHMILPNKVDDNLEYEIIDGYEFDKIDNNKIILKPIKSNYPKTYKECCGVLMGKTNFSEFNLVPIKYSDTTKFDNSISYDAPHIEHINNLYKLIICRDAYWKIAGKQMGLDKPWKPDWCNEDKLKFCIACSYGTIDKTVKVVWNSILSFPTEEMRDEFLNNFKDLIEQCKKLL